MNAPKPSSSSKKVLLTGFDAFGGETINPSWLAVQELNGQLIAGHEVVSAQLPTTFAASAKVLTNLLKVHRPELVICVGQAGGRSALSIERIAINVQDARIADNDGAQPIDKPVVRMGPAAYFSNLPIKAMLHAITQAGLPAEISQTAGTFVCNHLFYVLMHALKKQRGECVARGGFIHVPFLPAQGSPNMLLADMVRALEMAVHCALTTTEDRMLGAGSLD